MTANFSTAVVLLGVGVSAFVIGPVLGLALGRRSMLKHLAAAPQRFDELSAELDTAREESAKWKSTSEKWQGASESWQSAANRFEETVESLEEVISSQRC